MNEVLPLHHPAVSALLTTFREIAIHKGIKLEILIYYNLANIPCTVSEINKLIGNLVQNAIDEVEQHSDKDRWVQVMILKRSGNSVIKVTNRSNKEMNSYKHIFNPGYSTKPSHEGIGLTTVQKLVAKYNGAVYPEFEEDVVHFIVQIPNRLQ
jgi:sensor histidine kinase regulating citrate/malate metabolism